MLESKDEENHSIENNVSYLREDRIGAIGQLNTTWVIQNTGSQRWDQQEYDAIFVGAANNVYLHTGADRYDLTTTVDPGGTYNFTVPMLASFGPGAFGEMWQVTLGNQAICQFYVYIEVK